MQTEAQIRTAIAAKLQSVDVAARVHRRVRYPKQNSIAEFVALFRESELKRINGYMIRRVRLVPTLHGIPRRLVSIIYTYEIRFYFGLIDNDDDQVASEEAAQAKIDAQAAAFHADN